MYFSVIEKGWKQQNIYNKLNWRQKDSNTEEYYRISD